MSTNVIQSNQTDARLSPYSATVHFVITSSAGISKPHFYKKTREDMIQEIDGLRRGGYRVITSTYFLNGNIELLAVRSAINQTIFLRYEHRAPVSLAKSFLNF